ncbi:B-cell antigen receptor complex-associated protein beta chain-like [Thamnophis elegans]|uniref:B-cell antigen receptor complex-associated protein beta chain-like n=1 Tax=Thamnophis elegans TaxID=35005 RepID=UPI0013767D84|nr:B-cell antigen receptor complex-associated protein beta chain-like [Thamnophis elegans]
MGTAKIRVQHGNFDGSVPLLMVANQLASLLGLDWFESLGLAVTDINATSVSTNSFEQLTEEFPDVFDPALASSLDKPLWLKNIYQSLDKIWKIYSSDKSHNEVSSKEEEMFHRESTKVLKAYPACFSQNISQKQDATTFMNVINTRFIAARGGSRITLSCYFGTQASWHKETDQGKHQEIMNSSRVHVTRNNSIVVMRINKLQNNDNGIYHFKSKNSLKATCGTELKVMGISTYEQVQSRHNVKDAIILIQTILLVLFVSIPVLLTQGKVSEWNSHNRSGLMVELADTYEDIGVYQDRPEKWDFGEHLCEEQKG